MGSRMTTKLVCDALTMAIWQRSPKARLLIHTDRGPQYARKKYRNLLIDNKIIESMNRKVIVGITWLLKAFLAA